MNILATAIGILALMAVCLGFWQHRRYLRARREVVCDLQPLIYPARAFHAVMFLKMNPGSEVVEAARRLRQVIETPKGGKLVYAGQAGLTIIASDQVPNDWDAVLIAQYPSRAAYDEWVAGDDYRAVVASLASSYTHGLKRPWLFNLMIPQLLLGLRVFDILRRAPSNFPFQPVGDDARPLLKAKMKEVEQLERLRSLGEDAVVIVNLLLPGSASQRKADRGYARKMLGAMAEGAHGPVHFGRAVTVEGEADFKQVGVVYYPGIDHLRAMVGSTFMHRIGEGKQLGDSLAVVTVPILSRL